MKKRILFCFILALILCGLCACSADTTAEKQTAEQPRSTVEQPQSTTERTDTPEQLGTEPLEQGESTLPEAEGGTETTYKTEVLGDGATGSSILVAYFSCTGTTRTLAEYAAEILKADLYEIVPKERYTEEDLAYYTNGRADREQSDPSVRPAVSGAVENMEQYDTVILAYPIWHGQAPRIISTFLESYDFSGKTILPFCTSHSSGIGSSDTDLHALAKDAFWLEGKRFAAGTAREEIALWLEESEMTSAGVAKTGEFNFEARTVLLNSGYEMPINGLGTYSLHGDECIASVMAALENGVRLIDTASAYGNDVICCEV